jgi:hypothetical protein
VQTEAVESDASPVKTDRFTTQNCSVLKGRCLLEIFLWKRLLTQRTLKPTAGRWALSGLSRSNVVLEVRLRHCSWCEVSYFIHSKNEATSCSSASDVDRYVITNLLYSSVWKFRHPYARFPFRKVRYVNRLSDGGDVVSLTLKLNQNETPWSERPLLVGEIIANFCG